MSATKQTTQQPGGGHHRKCLWNVYYSVVLSLAHVILLPVSFWIFVSFDEKNKKTRQSVQLRMQHNKYHQYLAKKIDGNIFEMVRKLKCKTKKKTKNNK